MMSSQVLTSKNSSWDGVKRKESAVPQFLLASITLSTINRPSVRRITR